MKELKTPLTPEERLQSIRLIGHDSARSLFHIQLNAEKPEEVRRLAGHVRRVEAVIIYLSSEKLYLDQTHDDSYFRGDGYSINRLADSLKEMFPEKLSTFVSTHRPFLGKRDLLYTVLYNLVKNSLSANSKKVSIDIDSEEFSKDATFIPDGAKDYTRFMAFHIHDNGNGFPKDIPLADRLTTRPRIGSHGFGLYFTGLVARLMRAPVNIKSKKGETTVSFYHPIYE